MKVSVKTGNTVIYKVIYFTGLVLFLLPFMYGITGIIQIILLMVIAVAAELKYHLLEKLTKKENAAAVFFSLLSAFLVLFAIKFYPHYAVAGEIKTTWVKVLYLIVQTSALAVVFHPLCSWLSGIVFRGKDFDIKKFIMFFTVSGMLFFTTFVYLPCDSFFNNLSDFGFPLQLFIWHELICFVIFTSVISVFVSFFKENIFRRLTAFTFGLDLCVYIQYMFLNRNLIIVNGESMKWENYRTFSVLTIVLWLALIAGSVIADLKLHSIFEKIVSKGSAIILGMQVLSVIILTIVSGKPAFEYSTDYLSAEEQYTVSAGDNVIMFILDATDNAYFEEILQNNPEAFDGFEDFTLYTNTCSVYDYTIQSVTQMFTGSEKNLDVPREQWIRDSWKSPEAIEFYSRFHNSGYTVNSYNAHFTDERNYKGKLDNCFELCDNKENIDIRYNIRGVLKDFRRLALYRELPFAFKKYINYENIDFYSHVSITNKINIKNVEFERDLRLKLSSNEKDYFIVQHLNGTHPPCDDFIGETEYLLKIMKEYINQLKELGVYERSSIIITADHGVHNENNYETASVPILMIKKKNETKTEMAFSEAPVYHEDMQATLLDCAGLYEKKNDEKLFGRSVFDISEHEQRTRTWIDTVGNYYYEYTYTGNTEVLRKMVAEQNPTVKTEVKR